MSRRHSRSLGLALLVAAPFALLGPTGCADDKSTLFIRDVMAKPDDCLFKPDPSAAFIGQGMLDLAFTDTYAPFLLVGNQMVPVGNDNTLKTETSRISLKGAEVKLTTAGGAVIANYTTTTSGTIDPVAGPDPGYGVTQVTMIPPKAVTAPGSFIATVKVFGETLGNRNVESGEFAFPITVCQGCLVFFNKDSQDAGTCVAPSGSPVGACLPGQDGLSDCSLLPKK
jgi:hypothetical protein